MELTDSEVFGRLVEFRRSVRIFDADKPVPPEVIQRSLARAVLSPNSSNLQLWEFYWVRSPEKQAGMTEVCMGQNAAKTAQEFVVVVVRKDLWRKRCDAVIGQQVAHFKQTFGEPLSAGQKRILMYWQKVIPLLYRSGFGVLDIGKRVVAWLRGFVAATPREVSSGHMRIVAHRSVALAAMTFMHSVAAEGFDSCPMEGFDSRRLRRLLSLPSGAEFSMVIAIGSRVEKGVYGPRLRIPIEEVVFEV
jgi:nitroreductase